MELKPIDTSEHQPEFKWEAFTPRSQKALERTAIDLEDLVVIPFERFAPGNNEVNDIDDEEVRKDVCHALQTIRYEAYQKNRERAVHIVQDMRRQILREEELRQEIREKISSTTGGNKNKQQDSDDKPPPPKESAIDAHRRKLNKELMVLIKAHHQVDLQKREIVRKDQERNDHLNSTMKSQQDEAMRSQREELARRNQHREEARMRALQIAQADAEKARQAYLEKRARVEARHRLQAEKTQERTKEAQQQMIEYQRLQEQLNEAIARANREEQERVASRNKKSVQAANSDGNVDAAKALGGNNGNSGSMHDEDDDVMQQILDISNKLIALDMKSQAKQDEIASSSLRKPAVWPPQPVIARDPDTSPSRIHAIIEQKRRQEQAAARSSPPSNAAEEGAKPVSQPSTARGSKRTPLFTEIQRKREQEIIARQRKGDQALQELRQKDQAKLEAMLKEANEKGYYNPSMTATGIQREIMRREKERKQQRMEAQERNKQQLEERQRQLIEHVAYKHHKSDMIAESRAVDEIMQHERMALKEERKQQKIWRVQRAQQAQSQDTKAHIEAKDRRFQQWKSQKEREEAEKKLMNDRYIMANQRINRTLVSKAPREAAKQLQEAVNLVGGASVVEEVFNKKSATA